MNPFGFFDRRVRGFRLVEVWGLGFLLALILAVYLAKAGAGGKRADIDRVQQQITDEQTQIRILRAEVANLEQPERLEALSAKYLNLQPIPARRELTAEALQDVARVAIVDHKATPVTSDPLLQPGSPDLSTATPATAPQTVAAPQPKAPAITLAKAAPAAHGPITAKPGAKAAVLLDSGAAAPGGH